MENWLLIMVGVVFFVSIVAGAIRGFLKIGISLLSTVLTAALLAFLAPHVGDAIAKYTPLDELIQDKIIEAFLPDMSAESLADKDLSGTPLQNIPAEDIAKLTDLEWERLGTTTGDIMKIFGDIPKDQQIRDIEDSMMPDFLKDLLLENNNTAIYEELGVNSFPQYIASYISRMFLNLISFLITFILAFVIVKALMAAVDILGELPVLGAFNYVGGAALGAVGALLFVWVLFLAVAVCYSTPIGEVCFAMIDDSVILTILYESNPLMTWLVSF